MKLTEEELVRIIDDNIYTGIGGDEGEISNVRQEIFDRYMGELYGNERDGQSKITTREIFETVEWAMPSIMRPLVSGDRILEFEAESPEDEQGAEQETDAVLHVYHKDNKSFVTSHTIVKSALLNPNSYAKVWRDESEIKETEHYKNLNDQEIAVLTADPEVEVIGSEGNENGLWDLEIKRTNKRGINRIDAIPEEDIVVHNDHAELSLDDCEFVGHKSEKSHSYLLGLGYSEEDLDAAHIEDDYTAEEANRRFYVDEDYYNDSEDETHKALKKYTVWECYMLLDWDDDGYAERRRVVKIGNKIFDNEPIDYMPVVSAASILMPHKHTGLSMAQAIKDLQDVKTYFMRQVVTNMGKVNNPRTMITEGANLADVLSNRSNGIIRVRQAGDVTTEPTQPIIGQAIPLLDLIDQQKEGRTGITRNSMGLDADILSKSTEGAFMGALEKADQRVEFIVRVLTETVFKDIFLKIHHLLLSHGDTKWMKLNGQWTLVDPAEWKKREGMTCQVGLGISNHRQRMMAAKMVIEEQDKLLTMGLAGQLVSPQNLYNARRLLTESVGEKNVDKYFLNPAMNPPPPPQPPAPDPNVMMIQANKQIEDDKRRLELMKFQGEQALKAREQQWEQIEGEYKRQIDGLKASNDADNKDLQNQIKALQLQLDDAQKDEKNALEKYKAELQAGTQITLKNMDKNEEMAPIVMDALNNNDALFQNQQIMTAALSNVSELVGKISAPKEIIRDENGSPIGIRNAETGETQTITKDDQGLPNGLKSE